MKKGELIIAIVWMLFGIIIVIVSYNVGLGKLSAPGPGLMSFGVGIILSLCSFPVLINSLKKTAESGEQEGVWSEVDFKKIALVLGSLIAYMMLLERLGFLVTTFIIFFILFKVVGSQKWGLALVTTVITVSLTYLIFVVILNVYLPDFPFRIR